MQNVKQPGPVCKERSDLVPGAGCKLELMLEPDIALEDAVANALSAQSVDSAYLEIRDAEVSQLHYVIPAHAPDREQAAWYSQTYSFDAGHIKRMGMIVGKFNQASFLHGHGTWGSDTSRPAMGHVLAPQTVLSKPTLARGIGLRGACFNRRMDAETCFELFHVDQSETTGDDFAALKLRPNQDFTTALDHACHTLGWGSARVHGLGSLIGARFDDGRVLDSLPTEFLITDAVAGMGGPTPEIVIVGVDGADNILSGRLSRGENAVLITAELILERLS